MHARTLQGPCQMSNKASSMEMLLPQAAEISILRDRQRPPSASQELQR